VVGVYLELVVAWLSLLATIVSGGLQYDFDPDRHLDAKTFTKEWLKKVELCTQLSLPNGSKGLNLYYQHSQSLEPRFIGKIEIPTPDKDNIVKQIEVIQDKPMSAVGRRTLTKQVDWWEVSNVEILLERRFVSRTIPVFVHLVFCQKSEHYFLYFECDYF